MKVVYFLYKILPLVFWCLLILGFDLPYIAVLTVISAIIHECGHIFFAEKNKASELPEACLTGFRIKIHGMSYREEMLVAMGGPLFNFAVGILFSFAFRSTPFHSYSAVFAMTNFMTAFSNLLPIEGYDGYKILYCLGSMIFDDVSAFESALLRLSLLLSSSLCFLSLYLILKVGEGYWIFVIFFSVTLARLTKGKNTI